MKKMISLIMAILMCLPLCACGTSEAKFQEEYRATYDKVEELNAHCESVSSLVYDIWKAVGADLANDAFTYMLNIPEDIVEYVTTKMDVNFGGVYGRGLEVLIGDYYGWDTVIGVGINEDRGRQEFHAMCMQFQESTVAIKLLNDELAEEVKSLRATYVEKFGTEFDLLQDYYLEVSAFAEFSLEPSGSLASYKRAMNEYESEINKLAKVANIY